MSKRKSETLLESKKVKRQKVDRQEPFLKSPQLLSAEFENVTTSCGFPLCVVKNFAPKQILDFQFRYSNVGLQISSQDLADIIDSIWNINFTNDISQLVIDYFTPIEIEKPRTNLMFKLDPNEEIKRRKGYPAMASTPILKKYNAYKQLGQPQIFENWRYLAKTAVVVVPNVRLKEWKAELKKKSKTVQVYENTYDMSEMEIPEVFANKEHKLDYLTNLSCKLFDKFKSARTIIVTAPQFDKFAFACTNCDLVFGRVFFQDANTLRLSSGHYIHATRYWAVSDQPQDFLKLSSSKQHFLRWMLKQDDCKFNVI